MPRDLHFVPETREISKTLFSREIAPPWFVVRHWMKTESNIFEIVLAPSIRNAAPPSSIVLRPVALHKRAYMHPSRTRYPRVIRPVIAWHVEEVNKSRIASGVKNISIAESAVTDPVAWPMNP
jgi:hypothetical protein